LSRSAAAPGRVILGLYPGDFSHCGRPDTPLWNEETEAQYMDQVRERAQLMAKEILASALAEAEQIRQTARQEGLKDAQTTIEKQAAREKEKIGAFLAALETGLKAEKQRLFETHKDTLFGILRLAFEKTLGIVLDTQREQILTALLEEAVAHLHATSTITVHVSPQDADLAKEQLAALKTASPQLPELSLKISPELAPGGVRLECGDGVVDNSIATRLEQVRAALDAATEIQ
jgi:flagellar assembly protein FliH